MGLVAEGDISRSSDLFNKYHVAVYNYFLKISRDRALSEDMTQSVFEKLIKYRSSYTREKNFKAWLFTIARNVNIDHHRKKKFMTSECEGYEKESDVNLHLDLEKKERKNQLLAALDRLEGDEKELLVLTKFEKLKYAEVSKMLGISESAIKVKIHRSIKKLKTILINEIRYEH